MGVIEQIWIVMSDRSSIKFEDLAGAIHNWTGIDMTDEEAFNELVCEFMGESTAKADKQTNPNLKL